MNTEALTESQYDTADSITQSNTTKENPDMTQTITEEQAYDLLDSIEGGDDALYREYSGRGMYGRTCVGFVVDDGATDLLRLGAALVAVLGKVASARTDSLGLSTIVYFPSLTLADA